MVHSGTAGTFGINATALNVNTYPVYLLDKATNTYYDLATQGATFTTEGPEDRNNYSIVFKKASDQTENINGFALEYLYPNPANSSVSVGVVSNVNAAATITMTDILGRVVLSEEWPMTIGYNINQFDISKYADGAYTVTIFSGSIKTTRKLIIAK